MHISFKTKYLHHITSCLSFFFYFTHPLIFALDGFHGCCINCLLSLCSGCCFPPHFIHLFSDVALSPIVIKLGHDAAKIPVLYDLYYFTSSTFTIYSTVQYNELPLPVCAKFRMFWVSLAFTDAYETQKGIDLALQASVKIHHHQLLQTGTGILLISIQQFFKGLSSSFILILISCIKFTT